MSIPESLRRRSAIEARLSARFRAQARMLARYCNRARDRGLDNTDDAARAIEAVEAYAVALERWCLGEVTPQALARRYAALQATTWVALHLAASAIRHDREHLCSFPTHAPPWWQLTSSVVERRMVDCAVWVMLGEGSAETVRGEYATMLRAVEREDVERARAEKLPLEGSLVGSSVGGVVKA